MKNITIDENEIKQTVLEAVREKVATRYTYTAVDDIAANVLAEEESRKKLEKFVRSTLSFVSGDKAFEKLVKEEFRRKVAKSLVGKLEGTVERAVEKIRQNETLRAEMILAIERIVEREQ